MGRRTRIIKKEKEQDNEHRHGVCILLITQWSACPWQMNHSVIGSVLVRGLVWSVLSSNRTAAVIEMEKRTFKAIISSSVQCKIWPRCIRVPEVIMFPTE